MSSLNPSLRLALIKKAKTPKQLLQKGFTLVELMVVIVIVGILSAVALPQFLGVRGKAELGAEIGENMGLAKECSAAILIGGPYPTGCAVGGGEYTSAAADASSAGLNCGPTLTLAANDVCEIDIAATTGAMTYKLTAD